MADGEPKTDVPGDGETSDLLPSSSAQPGRNSEEVPPGGVPTYHVKNGGPTEISDSTQLGASRPTVTATDSSQPVLEDLTIVSALTKVSPDSESHELQSVDVDPLLKEIVEKVLSAASTSTVDQVDLVKLLHDAAQTGHIQLLKLLLEDTRIEVNEAYLGCTALIKACWKGHTEAVKLLLLKGADVLIRTGDGITCLHMAAFCGHTEVVNLLLHGKSHRECWEEADASLTKLSSKRCWALICKTTSKEMYTALHMAASGNHDQGVAIAASMLEAFRTSVLDFYGLASDPKAAYDIQTNLWLDYLFRVRQEVHNIHNAALADFPKKLAAYGNDGDGLEFRKKLGGKYEGLVRAFLELISFSNSRDKLGRTALHLAAWEDKDMFVKFSMWDSQLGSVAYINVEDVDGYTPLHLASRKGCIKVVQELLGIRVDDQLAASFDEKLAARFYDENYIEPNCIANPAGRSQELLLAIPKTKAMQKLQAIGQYDVGDGPIPLPRPEMENSIWSEDHEGITPLHYAVEGKHADVVGSLVMHRKTDVFKQASNGQSPWSIAFPVSWNNSPPPLTETQLSLKGDVEARFRPSELSRDKLREEEDKLREEEKRLYQQSFLRERDRERTVQLEKLQEKKEKLRKEREEELERRRASEKILLTMHQKKLLKQATALAIAAEYNLDSQRNLQVLEKQIFLSFETAYHQKYRWKYRHRLYSLSDLNLLHVAAYYGLGQELEALLKLRVYKKLVNNHTVFSDGKESATPLHFAVDTDFQAADAVAALLKEETLDLTEMYGNSTLLDFVKEYFSSESLGLDQATWVRLQENTSKLLSIEELYRNRQVYVDSANAILVGAALIASVAFGGFLQPPLGYVPYYTEFFPYPAPPSTPESFAAVAQHKMVWVFWLFNSLSFCFSIATVVAGAGTVLPSSETVNKREVVLVRKWLKVTATLLAVSIVCVLGAFTAAASAALPDVAKYQFSFILTAAVGLGVCLITLCAFGYRLITSIKKIHYVQAVLTLVFLEASIALYFLCRHLLHGLANDRAKLN